MFLLMQPFFFYLHAAILGWLLAAVQPKKQLPWHNVHGYWIDMPMMTTPSIYPHQVLLLSQSHDVITFFRMSVYEGAYSRTKTDF